VQASLSVVTEPPLRILFAAPTWWPSHAFGGPVVAARELVRRLVARGHGVDVLTTTIVDLHERPSARSSSRRVDGAEVHYLGTPIRYRWMGITPTLPVALERVPRPDVVHVFGFRDPVTTLTAVWSRARGVPYVFEPLGMLRPRLRKVRLKRALDATLYRGVARGADAVVVASELERADALACGVEPERIHVRGNGFPAPTAGTAANGALREELGIPDGAPLVLYVGRVAAGKGIEHLLAAAAEIPDAHVVFVGPDDRHGVAGMLRAAAAAGATAGRIHSLPATSEPPLDLYRQSDVFVLPSAGESFGMVAAEAAAAGTPVIVSDRCGVASFFADGEALVVPYDRRAVVDAVKRVLGDEALRNRLAQGGVAAAQRMSWDEVTARQEAIYRAVASRTAARKPSTDGS
jgi:glycosyltransferase involved in cell wall biosynthesis